MTRWKLTDAYEMGYEYECPDCGRHIDVRLKGRGLPDECPYCGGKMTETTREEAIRHFEHGVSHDIFSEPATSYAKMAISALREQPRWISVEEKLPGCDKRVLCRYTFGDNGRRHFHQVLDYYATDPQPHFQHTLGDSKMRVTHWMDIPALPEPPKEAT